MKPKQTASKATPTRRSDSSAPENSGPEVVLLAVTGMSPAILTETIWAMAEEKPPLIPDRVIVVTTSKGRDQIERELFSRSPDGAGPCVWDALHAGLAAAGHRLEGKLRFGLTGDDVRVFTTSQGRPPRTQELEDITTPTHNEAAADFIMDQVRQITENPDTRLIASIAGGRKTMSALLYAVLSLLGRPQDRLTHVLVREPFENPGLKPRFYFPPASPVTHKLTDHAGNVISKHRSSEAQPLLADVPFVRLRRLFPQQIGRLPGRFNDLVRRYSEKIEEMSGPPQVKLGREAPVITVNGTPVNVSAREFALFAFLAERCEQDAPAYGRQYEAVEDFKRWLAQWGQRFPVFSFQHDLAAEWKSPEDEDLRKQISSLRRKIRDQGLGAFEASLLPPPRGRFGINITMAKG